MKNVFIVLLIHACLFCSCSDESVPQSVSFSRNVYELGQEGGTVEVGIVANCKWTISADNTPWMKIYTESGEGDFSPSIFVHDNPYYDDRQFEVMLTSEDKTSSSLLTIKQKAKLGLDADFRTSIPAEGGEFDIKVKTNTEGVEKILPDWITFTSSRALTEYVYTFTAEPNQTGASRSGVIKLVSGELLSETKVEQPTMPVPIASLTIEQGDLFIDVDSVVQLKTGFEPQHATETELEWSSSDPNVATVDEAGNLTPIGTGTCTITAKSPYSGVSASISVEVKIKITHLEPKNYDKYGNKYEHRWWPGREEIIYVNYQPDNAYLGDLYLQVEGITCAISGRTVIAKPGYFGSSRIDFIDPYSGISTDARVYIDYSHSYTGIVGPVQEKKFGGFELAYGGCIYTNKPNSCIEIVGISMKDEDNYFKPVYITINDNLSDKVSFCTERFNSKDLFGDVSDIFSIKAKFIISYKVDGVLKYEEFDINTRQQVNI